jgi:hypothetical protein
MKSQADICWVIDWCCFCIPGAEPCTDVEVPDHIPDKQILKYMEEKKYV